MLYRIRKFFSRLRVGFKWKLEDQIHEQNKRIIRQAEELFVKLRRINSLEQTLGDREAYIDHLKKIVDDYAEHEAKNWYSLGDALCASTEIQTYHRLETDELCYRFIIPRRMAVSMNPYEVDNLNPVIADKVAHSFYLKFREMLEKRLPSIK